MRPLLEDRGRITELLLDTAYSLDIQWQILQQTTKQLFRAAKF